MLHLQHLVASKRIQILAESTLTNVGDLGTKYLQADRIEFLAKRMGLMTKEEFEALVNMVNAVEKMLLEEELRFHSQMQHNHQQQDLQIHTEDQMHQNYQ